MAIVNLTPFQYAAAPGRIAMPGHSLTFIVKGTFRLVHDAAATVDDEQLPPTGDEYYPDDEERTGGPRYASDFALFKPRADVMLVGACRAPGGNPSPACEVAFALGPVVKTLVVTGDRTWQRHFLRWVPGEAEPFSEMPLRYERSFGGEGFPDNPIGRGVRPTEDDAGERTWALPNIEGESEPVSSRRDRPRPAGLGPTSDAWRERRQKLGTYDRAYVTRHWPGFPDDFDWSYFNAAPADMQVEGYLRGDETVSYSNLHRTQPHFQGTLPGVRVRCFVSRVCEGGQGERFEEVAMNLDTAWVDADAERVVLVWRGWTDVVSEDAEDVADVFILDEPLDAPVVSLEECHRRMVEAKRADDGVDEAETASAADHAQPEHEDVDAATATPDPAAAADASALEAQVAAWLAQAGIDPASIPPEARERQRQLLARLTSTGPSADAARQEGEFEAQFAKVAASFGLDPHNIPPPSEQARKDQRRLLAALGMDKGDLPADPLSARLMGLLAVAMPSTGQGSAVFDHVVSQAEALRDRLVEPREPEGSDSPDSAAPALTREVVCGRAAAGDSFAGEDLSGLDLSGLDLRGLDFSNATLVGATLTGADLQDTILTGARASGILAGGANFARATLAGADLSDAQLEHACLSDADFTSGNLERARLSDSNLSSTVFEHARLLGATLDRVEAAGASFARADLTGASARESRCDGADFSGSRLDRVCFAGASLREAACDQAVGIEIDCTRADLGGLRAADADFTRGRFSRCQGDGANFEGAVLTEADFRWAHLHRASFMSATLSGADLEAADMKFARFIKADLSAARLVDCNLFQGSLERALLARTDLSRAHLFGAELLDARIDETVFAGANLRRTKLQDVRGA